MDVSVPQGSIHTRASYVFSSGAGRSSLRGHAEYNESEKCVFTGIGSCSPPMSSEPVVFSLLNHFSPKYMPVLHEGYRR